MAFRERLARHVKDDDDERSVSGVISDPCSTPEVVRSNRIVVANKGRLLGAGH